jgi:outer membrane protein TolC
VLSETGAGQATCRAARVELVSADSQLAAADRASRIATTAFERGETGRIEVAQAQLLLLRARRASHLAGLKWLGAGQAVERAAGLWREQAARWPDPRLEDESKAEVH